MGTFKMNSERLNPVKWGVFLGKITKFKENLMKHQNIFSAVKHGLFWFFLNCGIHVCANLNNSYESRNEVPLNLFKQTSYMELRPLWHAGPSDLNMDRVT